MPDGQDQTIDVVSPNGKVWTIPKANLSKAQERGFKPYTPKQEKPSNTAGDFLSAAGEQLNPVTAVKGAAQFAAHPIDTYMQDAAQRQKIFDTAKQRFGSKDYAGAASAGLYSMIPFFGPQLEKAGEDISTGHYARGAGSSVGMGLAAALPEKIPGALRAAGGAAKGTMREFMGVADKDIAPVLEKSAADTAAKEAKYKSDLADALKEHDAKLSEIEQKNAKAQADHEAKVQDVRAKAAEKIATQNEKAVTSSKQETAAKTKQSVATKQGPVYQRLVETADKAQANVQQVDTKIRALEKAKWNAFERKVGPANVSWTPVQEAVAEAEENILKGSPENITIFKNILKEGEGILSQASVFRGGDIAGATNLKEVMRTMDPVRRDRFLRDLEAKGVDIPGEQKGTPRTGTEVPLDTARGYSTELGQKIYGRELPGDVRRALHSVQDAIEGETVKTIAQKAGKEGVLQYRALRSAWRDYMEAFYDKDSPLRKLKEGKDPGDKLRPIVGDEGQRAISLFGKYKDLGADVGTMGKLRALNTAVKELPSSAPKAAASSGVWLKSPEVPTAKQAPAFQPPEAPTGKPITAAQAREQGIEHAAKSYTHPPSRWEMMIPPLHAYRLLLKNLLQSEGFKKWISEGK